MSKAGFISVEYEKLNSDLSNVKSFHRSTNFLKLNLKLSNVKNLLKSIKYQ